MVGWDRPLPEKFRTQWETWLQDLQNLANVIIRRCNISTNLTDVKQYELHHFSDARITGYGERTSEQSTAMEMSTAL